MTVDGIGSKVDTKIANAKGEITKEYTSAITQKADQITLKVSAAQTAADNAQSAADAAQGTADTAKNSVAELKVTMAGISTTVANKADTSTLDSKVSALNTSISIAKKSAIDTVNARIDGGVAEFYQQASPPSFTNLGWTKAECQRHAGALWYVVEPGTKGYVTGHLYRFVVMRGTGGAWEDVDDSIDSATTVQQNASGWNVASGMFDAKGNLTASGVASITPTVTTISNTRFDENWGAIKSGYVATGDFARLFSQACKDGEVVTSAQISTFITKDEANKLISNATIQADKIALTGHTMAFTGNQITIDTSNFKLDGSGNVEMSGKVVAMSGQIAGMKISGLGLTNAGFDNDAYIILRNDKLNTFAGIGYHVAAYESGVNAVAHFSNGETKDSGEKNYAMVVNAYGADDNIAIGISGGYIEGLRVKTGMLTAGGASSNSPVKISKGIHSIMIAGAGYYQLPAMEKNDDGYVLFLKNEYNGSINIVTSSGINRKGEKKDTFILFNRGDKTTNLTVDSRGDAMVFVYHRDVVQEGYNFRGGCWVQYKCPRDW